MKLINGIEIPDGKFVGIKIKGTSRVMWFFGKDITVENGRVYCDQGFLKADPIEKANAVIDTHPSDIETLILSDIPI